MKLELKRKKIKLSRQMILYSLGGLLIICLLFLLFSNPSNISAQAMEEMKAMSVKIHESFRQKPDYWGLSNDYIIKNQLAPKEAVREDKIISLTGAQIFVGSGEDGYMAMPGSQSFDIVYKGLSRKNCVILASYNLDYMEKLGLLSLTIKNAKESKEFSWGGENKLPVDIADAKDACMSSNNTIIWTFK